MSTFSNIRDYYAYVVHKVAKSHCSTDWAAIKFSSTSRKRGTVSANPLHFDDGSTLRFREEIVLENGGVNRPVYSCHYEQPAMTVSSFDMIAPPLMHVPFVMRNAICT